MGLLVNGESFSLSELAFLFRFSVWDFDAGVQSIPSRVYKSRLVLNMEFSSYSPVFQVVQIVTILR